MAKLIEKPLFPKNFSGKYIDTSLEISLESNSEKAIDIMKKAIDEYPKLKKEKLSVVPKKKNIALNKKLGKDKKKFKNKKK